MATLVHSIPALSILQIITLLILLAVTVGITIRQIFTICYPANLPRVREEDKATRFSLKTRLAYYTDCKNIFREAYERYSIHGKTCLIPGLGFRDEVIIPNSSLRWLTSQPDRVLSTYDAFVEMDQADYNVGHHKYISDPWQGMLVKRDMNSVLENLMVALGNELEFAFDARFGTKANEWTEITLLKTMKLIVAQGSSRFTVGLPLCRNEQYLINSIAHSDLFIIGAGLVGAMPKFLRPLLGPLATLPIRYQTWKIKQEFKPLFHQRLQFIQNPKDEKDPQDHLQMMFRYAQTDRPAELNLHDMTIRLALSNLGSFHQTSIAITNIIFHIAASDKEYDTIALLREEISAVLAAHKNTWTKAVAAQMIRADSVCRETLRINSFGNRSVMRKVMVDDLRTEDGILLPKGAMVSILAHPAQCDGNIFKDPLKFDPWRFSNIRENATDSSQHSNVNTKTGGNAPNLSFVSTGPHFLPFGHGRHACPGRFLLDFELKMMIAYILTNYDVELPEMYQGERPESKWMAEAIMPPSEGKLKIRRRMKSNS